MRACTICYLMRLTVRAFNWSLFPECWPKSQDNVIWLSRYKSLMVRLDLMIRPGLFCTESASTASATVWKSPMWLLRNAYTPFCGTTYSCNCLSLWQVLVLRVLFWLLKHWTMPRGNNICWIYAPPIQSYVILASQVLPQYSLLIPFPCLISPWPVKPLRPKLSKWCLGDGQ